MGIHRIICGSGAAVLALGLLVFGAISQDKPPSRAYVGHENDRDIGNFIRQYPEAAGSRLNDCQTCHRGGVKGTDTEREFNPCGYCHLLEYPNTKYRTGVPQDFKGTLNAFGLAYEKAGRTVEALAEIAGQDADGDGYPNAAEIVELRYPGDAGSRPGQPLAPVVFLSEGDIRKLPSLTQFMLMNATKEFTDDYVTYRGVRVLDVLAAAGVDIKGAAGITVFAPDGYSVEYTIEDISLPFLRGYFYRGPVASKDGERSFVHYPAAVPSGVEEGKEIPDQPWLLLAFERGGEGLEDSSYEKGTGRLAGEGPFRLVKPQRDLKGDPSKPGRPDRSSKAKTYGDGWDFNAVIDHNAGACVRGACVIRVNPAPAGFEEYDWKNGWPLSRSAGSPSTAVESAPRGRPFPPSADFSPELCLPISLYLSAGLGHHMKRGEKERKRIGSNGWGSWPSWGAPSTPSSCCPRDRERVGIFGLGMREHGKVER